MQKFRLAAPALAIGLGASLGAWLAASAARAADPVADFYSGKSVQLVIGYAPGGGYDIYARALSRHMGIPGNPSIVVQNMLRVPLRKRSGELVGHAIEALWLGSTGAGADSDVFPTVLRRMFHLPMKVVTGYHSAADVVLAITRKEVDGRCGWSWSSMMAWNKDMYQSKAINVALQLATERLAELPDTPTILEVAGEGDQRAALRLIISRQMMARPYVAPPGIPSERLKALRAAFDATMQDPEFLKDAQRQDLEVRPLSGAQADALIAEIYASPPAVVKLAVDVMKE